MNRLEQHKTNMLAIKSVAAFDDGAWQRAPSYKFAIDMLNSEGLTTSRGNRWTQRSLYRMLQREGYPGLHGLFLLKKMGIFKVRKKKSSLNQARKII